MRIEDQLYVVSKNSNYIGFQNFTRCPYQINLIDRKYLSEDDLEFIEKYHQKVIFD